MTTHDYKPKHRRPDSWAGSTPRGPERWGRAAHNALTNPLSKSAKLYADRVATARRFLDYEEKGEIFEHREESYDSGDFMGSGGKVIESVRKYLTCNIVCAAMQVQLDYGTTAFYEVSAIMANNYRRTYAFQGKVTYSYRQMNVSPLDPSEVKRTVRCQTCGTAIRPGRKARR